MTLALIPGADAPSMERAERMDLVWAASPLPLAARVALAKAHCALVFEDRGGTLTDAEVVSVARCWTDGTGQGVDGDTDLLAAHLFAWLG
jgi:hypothetical protein